MKYCEFCGKDIHDEAIVCIHCKEPVTPKMPVKAKKINAKKSKEPIKKKDVIFLILGIIFPLVGLILYFTFKKENASRKRAAKIGMIIGFIILGVIIAIILFLIIAALIILLILLLAQLLLKLFAEFIVYIVYWIFSAIGYIFIGIFSAIFEGIFGALAL